MAKVRKGRDPGDDGDTAGERWILGGEQSERPTYGDTEDRDAAAARVGAIGRGANDGDRCAERPSRDLPPCETGQVRHEDEVAGAREPAREALHLGMVAASGGCAVHEDDRHPASTVPGPDDRGGRAAHHRDVVDARVGGQRLRRPRQAGCVQGRCEDDEGPKLGAHPRAIDDRDEDERAGDPERDESLLRRSPQSSNQPMAARSVSTTYSWSSRSRRA